MEAPNGVVNPRKRRRRRRLDRPAISARLLLDDRIKGEEGVLSDDLFHDLFPGSKSSGDDAHASNHVRHVAITPWLPSSVVASQNVPWTILPVRSAGKSEASAVRPHSSLQIPTSSLALQSFSHVLHSIAPNRTQRKDAPIEVRIYDVVPLGLDAVYVNLDTEALRKLDEVHAKFGGGFLTPSNGAVRGPKNRYSDMNGGTNGKGHRVDHAAQEEVWRKAVREALQLPTVLHTGDLLPLPLPAHPITHVAPPPAKITACEPVSQGLLLPSTRIVVLQSHRTSKTAVVIPSVKQTPLSNGFADDSEAEDTSNDTFFSAAEDRADSRNASPPDDESADNFESLSEMSDGGDLSDESDDIISLNAPMLPPQSSGVLSSFTSATPRPGNFRTNGIATPGSVYSSFTATTARGPTSKSKVFKAQGLLQSIPDELVHPKPGSEDDEEARLFVDTNALVKVGCFSGDWVKVEASEEPSSHPLWGLGAFGGVDDEDNSNWRPVRVYGLPESMSNKIARYPVHKTSDDRRSSFSGFGPVATSLQAYLSPILLANMGSPSHLRITPLASHQPSLLPRTAIQKPRLSGSSLPRSAKEVTLLKLSTPLSSDRLLQPSLFAALKEHFEKKRRIVKSGDLIGISIDESLGRAVFQTTTEDDPGNDELLSKPGRGIDSGSVGVDNRNMKVVSWFKIGNVSSSAHAQRETDEDDIWGGAVTVDAASTKMEMNGSEQGKTPPINSAWQYYLGAKRTPISNSAKTMSLDELPKPYVSALRRRLRELMSVATSPRAIHLGLPPIAVLITSTQRGIGKCTVAAKACEDLGLHAFAIDAFDIVTEGGAGGGDVKTEGFLKARAERALTCGAEYTALVVKHIDALNADRMITALKEILADARVLIATTTEIDKVPEGIRGLFTHEIEMTAPDEREREGILRSIIDDAGIRLSPEADLSNVAVKTAALVAGDLVDVVDRALVAKQTRLEALATTASKSSSSETVAIRDIELAGGHFSNSLTKADLDGAVDAARKNFADAIGAPKIPNVGWSDVGGLTHVKDAVMETIQLPLSRPELFAKGMKKRSGILFYGPPGTGKTLLAKAIATEFSLNFFSVKGPELLNMYIGESEANVRRVFQRARDARPCVVFFDELDSVAPKRGNQGDSGGVMDRIVSQLLAELDGMSDGGEGVFVIGATNRPDLLDQALLRPGRFDKMLYLGVSDTHEKQQTILEALTRKFTLHPELSLQRVSRGLPFTYTGADMYALCSDAMLKAITRQAKAVDAKVKAYNDSHAQQISIAYFFDHLATDEDTAVMVMEQDFVDAHNELVPSVSADELRHYETVRKTFEGTGQKENEKKQKAIIAGTQNAVRPSISLKGKGKAKAASDEESLITHTENIDLNGASTGSGSGKGKGKAPAANHASKNSVDIAEGGFGDATQDDDLYS
ncbi:peroxisomal assembly protein [Coniothyrium glycines]